MSAQELVKHSSSGHGPSYRDMGVVKTKMHYKMSYVLVELTPGIFFIPFTL